MTTSWLSGLKEAERTAHSWLLSTMGSPRAFARDKCAAYDQHPLKLKFDAWKVALKKRI